MKTLHRALCALVLVLMLVIVWAGLDALRAGHHVVGAVFVAVGLVGAAEHVRGFIRGA